MTEKEKRTILDMRAAGKQYKEISAELGIEVSALKVFVHRQKQPGVRKCAMCGKRLPDKARASQRFCSVKCKNAWWKKHPNEDENDKRVGRACTSCGKLFISYNPNSKYCSRDCYYASKRKAWATTSRRRNAAFFFARIPASREKGPTIKKRQNQ